MPSMTIRAPLQNVPDGGRKLPANPLPSLLQTPSGLAIIELQGTINFPEPPWEEEENEPPKKKIKVDDTATSGVSPSPSTDSESQVSSIKIGRVVFPLYDPKAPKEDTSWMKRVHFYVGKHQRMTGEVRKLAKPLLVMRVREDSSPRLGGQADDLVRNTADAGDETQRMHGADDGPSKHGKHEAEGADGRASKAEDYLQIEAIVRYKILFTSRPEPTGTIAGISEGND